MHVVTNTFNACSKAWSNFLVYSTVEEGTETKKKKNPKQNNTVCKVCFSTLKKKEN